MRRALLVLGMVLVGMSGTLHAQTALVPYSSSGFRYLQIPNMSAAPPGFELPGFDDSGWSVGCTPFGDGCDPSTTCSPWTVNTIMLLRRQFDLPDLGLLLAAEVGVAIDNDVQVWINGVDVTGFVQTGGCATLDKLVVPFSTSLLTPTGNTLVVLANDRGIVARIDVEVRGEFTWEDLGLAKSGSQGDPTLAGTGTLASGTANQLDLTLAHPSSTATLVFGLAAVNAPFKGGTLVPQPLVLVPLPTDGTGNTSLPFVMPAGIPPALELYFQFWIQDPTVSPALSASNGLKGTTS